MEKGMKENRIDKVKKEKTKRKKDGRFEIALFVYSMSRCPSQYKRGLFLCPIDSVTSCLYGPLFSGYRTYVRRHTTTLCPRNLLSYCRCSSFFFVL